MCTGTNDNQEVLQLTETQKMVSSYFTPTTNIKGMVLWHSVGTGKTCTAVAMSRNFANQGYNVLWVTTKKLMSEGPWKNVFKKICDGHIADMFNEGTTVPYALGDRAEAMAKFVPHFTEPMTHINLTNAIEPSSTPKAKSKIRNTRSSGVTSKDPLYKTLIIIDEAHKMYDNLDLNQNQRANMVEFEKAIRNSYSMSGENSCKLLLLTATPIVEHALYFCNVLNLLIDAPKGGMLPQVDMAKIKSIHTTYQKKVDEETRNNLIKNEIERTNQLFRETYGLNAANQFSTEGKTEFQNTIKGLVSYLDYSNDPQTFALKKKTVLQVKRDQQNGNNGVDLLADLIKKHLKQ